ncbi:hypothetical protein [Agrobacterium tumefaciens]|uniref:hypothetical protein n=1 Tax=Agrobacterium tumefaciens TaxID=358 RepID=UPI0015719191|nr:hypothetical protein [Agrobacterium tumefaciens]
MFNETLAALEAIIPENWNLTAGSAVMIVFAIALVAFIIRKLLTIALIAIAIVAGWMVWNDPSLLASWGEAAQQQYNDWQQSGARR